MLTNSRQPIPERVEALLDAVGALEPGAWLAAGSRDETAGDAAAVATATLIRDAAIADNALDYPAWLVRDALETLAWLNARRLGRVGATDRARFARGHEQFERAALALLVADALPARDLQALCAAIAPASLVDAVRPPSRDTEPTPGLDAW